MDSRDSFADVLVPALLAVPLDPTDTDLETGELLEFTREARELLRGWDGTTPAGDSEAGAAAAYFNAVWRNLLELLFDDELPPASRPTVVGATARRSSSCSPTPRAPGGTTS